MDPSNYVKLKNFSIAKIKVFKKFLFCIYQSLSLIKIKSQIPKNLIVEVLQ